MAEEKQKKKKRSILKQIFRRIGLGLLAILLILAIVFQAPWKVITILFIILAACTILPKHLRKWFWLSAAAIVVILVIWVFLPDDDEGWRPYTFDEELAALEAKYAVPDEENAALIYYELFKTMNGDPNEPEFFLRSRPSSIDEPWLSKNHPEMADWLKGHQNKITILLQAAKKDKCHFPILAYPWDLDQHMERLPKIRRCTFLLLSAANNDIAEVRIDAVLEKYLGILQMAKHTCQQQGDLPTFISLEKLMLKNTFGGLFYEVNSKGKARLSRDPLALIRNQAKEQLAKGMWDDYPETRTAMHKWSRPTGFWVKRGGKVLTILLWLFVPRTPEKLSRIVDDGFDKLYIMTKPVFDWSKEPKEVPIESFVQFKLNFRRSVELTAQANEKLYFGLHDNYLWSSVKQRGTLLIIALRRYKNKYSHWPENLEEVKSFAPAEIFVDPINGDYFVYKLTEDNFILYSMGKNAIDEAGQYESKRDPNTYEHTVEKDDRLIWPRRSRKTKEEKADDEQQ